MQPATCLYLIALICAPFLVCGIFFTFILDPSPNFMHFCVLLCMCIFTLESHLVYWGTQYNSVFLAPI